MVVLRMVSFTTFRGKIPGSVNMVNRWKVTARVNITTEETTTHGLSSFQTQKEQLTKKNTDGTIRINHNDKLNQLSTFGPVIRRPLKRNTLFPGQIEKNGTALIF
jgi:hypothetical protein